MARNAFERFRKADLATVDAVVRKIETTTDPAKLDLWFMALAAAGDGPGEAGAKAQREFMRLHDRVPVYGVQIHDVVKISKAELERRQAVEKAYELSVLEKEHPTLYADLQAGLQAHQVRKAVTPDTIGRTEARRQFNALCRQYVVDHRPKPTLNAKPVGLGADLAEAYAAVRQTSEGKRLYSLGWE